MSSKNERSEIEEIKAWTEHLETLIGSLGFIDPKLLPASFEKDVVGPLCNAPQMPACLKDQLEMMQLCDKVAELSSQAEHRSWFFWENVGNMLADFSKSEEIHFYSLTQQNQMIRIHPPGNESENVETMEEEQDYPAKVEDQQYVQAFDQVLNGGKTQLLVRFLSKRPIPRIKQDRIALITAHTALLLIALKPHLPSLKPPKEMTLTSLKETADEEAKLLGRDPSFLAAVASLEQAADSEATIYLAGESGTGKELFAKHLHQNSPRKDGPFVPINCSAIPHELIESEMFGHEKGAFTGAYYRKIGKVEQAHGGTLFLDEIGEMPLAFQAKLLRYIQERKFSRVGGNNTHFSDARIVVATHRDLQEMVDNGKFREDLYYRVNVIPIRIPPLRERGQDVRLLSKAFFHNYISKSRASRRKIQESVFDCLEQYNFPGNVRELDNIIQRTVVMTQKPTITAEDLPDEVLESWLPEFEATFRLHPFEKFDQLIPEDRETLRLLKKDVEQVSVSYNKDLERRFLLHLLRQSEGSARKAAELAEINRTLFYKLLKRSGLEISLLDTESEES